MKNFLVGIMVLPILAMPYTYFYIPALKKTTSMRQEISNYKASLGRFAEGRDRMLIELLAIQKENVEKENKALNFLLPAFDTAKANLMMPFDTLRDNIPGEWNVVPEGKFRNSSPLVFWAFKFKYVGTFNNAVKVLASMEINPQFMRIENYRIETKENEVELSGKVELVFQEKLMDMGALK